VTTKNEEKNIDQLLKTLVTQEQPIEIIVVDAGSKDATQSIVKSYMQEYPYIKLYIKEGTRGESMNYGIKKAKGEAISFIGADDRADKNWIKYVRIALKKGHDIVVGKCLVRGKKEFLLDRVSIYHKGFDISYPGSNTTYRKEILIKLGGFDTAFLTAEDIDLNYRAVDAGYKIYVEERAVVYRYSRGNIIDFLKQAFWYGYGRKQLALKHGELWQHYSFRQTFSTHLNFYGIIRLFFGLLGYLTCKMSKGGFTYFHN